MLGAFVLAILVSNLFIYPIFTKMLIRDTESEAVMVARHMSNMLFREDTTINRPHMEYVWEHLDEYIRDFELNKLKVFDRYGKTIFSTDQKDEGVINEHDYFRNEVSHGNVFSKVVKKNAPSLEGQIMQSDVVETYVPIMSAGAFRGALEIYYDITDQRAVIRKALLYCNILFVSFAAFFLLLSITIARKLDDNIAQRENAQQFLKMANLDLKDEITHRRRAEMEKEKVIAELEQSLEKIKVLSGLVPICSFCKNIRNDAGYWEQMEAYIEKYSDAQFSHGLCPDCAAKHYPELESDGPDPEKDGGEPT